VEQLIKFIKEVNIISSNKQAIRDETVKYLIDDILVYLPYTINLVDISNIAKKINFTGKVTKIGNYVIDFSTREITACPKDITMVTDKFQRCVSALIIDPYYKILLQDHVKLERFTIPGGKVDLGEDKQEALLRELQEELGIEDVKSMKFNYTNISYLEYPANSGQYKFFEDCNYIIFTEDIVGKITNKEPKKHKTLKWASKNEIGYFHLRISAVLEKALTTI